MKKITLTLAFLVSSTFASAMQIQAYCQFNRAQGSCSVFNNFPRPIYCSLRAQGITASGAYGTFYENATVYPGSYAYVYVNANNPYIDPLVRVNGYAECNFGF